MDAVRQDLPGSPLALSWRFAEQLTRYEAQPAPVAKIDLRLRLRCAQLRVRRLFDAIESDIRLSPVQVACLVRWARILYRASISVGDDGRRCAHVGYERAVAALSRGVHRTTGMRRLGLLTKWNIARDAFLTVGDAFEHVVQIPLLDEKWVLANRDVLQARNRKKEPKRVGRCRTAASGQSCARTHKHPPQSAPVGGSHGKFVCPPPKITPHGDAVAGRASQPRNRLGKFFKKGSPPPREEVRPPQPSVCAEPSVSSRSAPRRNPLPFARNTDSPAAPASGCATLKETRPQLLNTDPQAAALYGADSCCSSTAPQPTGEPLGPSEKRTIQPCTDVVATRAYLARLAAQEAARTAPEGRNPSHARTAQQSAPRGAVGQLLTLSHAVRRGIEPPDE